MIMKTPESTFAEALLQAHTDLLGDVREVQEGVHSESGKGPAELRACLEKVRAHILSHFAFEEQGGYMAAVLKEEPRLAPETQELLRDHGQLAQELDALIEEAAASRTLGIALRDKVLGWIRHVRHHEARENSLVQEAYYSSGATGD
jgi:hypothetical protein